MSRPRHRDKELESILKSAEDQGWSVTGGGHTYFKLRCPCPLKCRKIVHCTPSSTHYRRNLLGQLRRATCWKEG